LVSVRPRVHVLPDLRARRRRCAGLLARVGDLQGLRDRVPLVRRQSLAPARRRRGLHARPALREGPARHAHLSELRGANDVMRAFIALGGIKPVGEKLEELGGIELGDPIGSIGVLIDYASDRIQREVRPDKITMAHDELSKHADSVSDQVKRLAGLTEKLLRENKKRIIERQFQQKRLADAIADIYAQLAILSRISHTYDDQGVEASGQEKFIADTFCGRAARRVGYRFDQVESNDDDRMTSIAKLAYKRGEYGYALFEDYRYPRMMVCRGGRKP